eukprot:13794209-Alexandrium_andersonii.AAC.1
MAPALPLKVHAETLQSSQQPSGAVGGSAEVPRTLESFGSSPHLSGALHSSAPLVEPLRRFAELP